MACQMEGWADDYGQDFEVRILGQRCIVVIDPVEIRRIATLRPSKFRRGLNEHQFTRAGRMLGVAPSMFFNEGSAWGRSRRIISPSFHRQNVDDMIPAMTVIADRLLRWWSTCAASGEVVDANDDLSRYAHDIIALAGLGLQAKSTEAKQKRKECVTYDGIRCLIDTLMKIIYNPLASIGWVYLPSLLPWVRKAKHMSAQMEEVVQGMVERTRAELRRARGETSTPANGGSYGSPPTKSGMDYKGKILRKIVSAGKDISNGERMSLSDEEVLREIKTNLARVWKDIPKNDLLRRVHQGELRGQWSSAVIFIAGTDTTALTLSWALYYLTKNPDMHARCRKEALEVAPNTDGLVSTPEQRSRLVYCSAVFQETLRMKPAALRIVLHSTEDYTMRNGVKAPAGTAFFLMTRYAAISEKTFTRAKEFIPERWIEAEREEVLLGKGVGHKERTVRHSEEAFMAFGGGPRICPGQDVAKWEAAIILAAACARFNFSLAPGQADPPREMHHFTSGPEAVNLIFTRA